MCILHIYENKKTKEMLISNQIWISKVESSLNIGRKKSSRGDYGAKDDALAASHQDDWRYHENYGKPGDAKDESFGWKWWCKWLKTWNLFF